jgi:choline monooxygenase
MNIRTEIDKFKQHLGIESCETPPASWCIHPDFYDLDQKILKSHWQFVCSADQLAQPGAYVAGEFCNEQYVVTKTDKGEIKAFYNVCRHHAAQLLHGEGCTKEIVCPYHAWSYTLEGTLKKAPHMAGVKNFSRENLSLKEIPLKILNKFILLNFSGLETPLDPEWSKLDQLLNNAGTAELKFKGRRVYEINCNWKVYIDNYLDGGYHVDHLHKGLSGQLDMQDYKTENFATWTLQSCGGSKDPMKSDTIDFKERIGGGALYAWMHPNFMVNRYGPIMDTNWIVPVGHQKCLTIFDYYFKDDATPEFIEASIKASEQVQIEDVTICESVQKGMLSNGYGAGRYSPALETGEFLFHSLMKEGYLKLLNGTLHNVTAEGPQTALLGVSV